MITLEEIIDYLRITMQDCKVISQDKKYAYKDCADILMRYMSQEKEKKEASKDDELDPLDKIAIKNLGSHQYTKEIIKAYKMATIKNYMTV